MYSIDIKKVLIVGAGTMGQQIGLQCALYDFEVAFYDLDPDALDRARANIAAYLDDMVENGHVEPTWAVSTRTRMRFTADAAAAAEEADLLSESVPEDPLLKGRIFAQFNELCPAHTLFTTNTSTLVPSMFARDTGRPSQFAALHFHLPVWLSNIVDVMPHPGTDPQVIEILIKFARRIGQIPIVLEKEHHSYVFNHMLNALSRSAMELAANGIAAVEDVDRAWMGVMKTPIGPFGILDQIGLETIWKITDFWATALNDHQLRANADFVSQYIAKGRLGVKNGKGFYDYPDPAYTAESFLLGK